MNTSSFLVAIFSVFAAINFGMAFLGAREARIGHLVTAGALTLFTIFFAWYIRRENKIVAACRRREENLKIGIAEQLVALEGLPFLDIETASSRPTDDGDTALIIHDQLGMNYVQRYTEGKTLFLELSFTREVMLDLVRNCRLVRESWPVCTLIRESVGGFGDIVTIEFSHALNGYPIEPFAFPKEMRDKIETMKMPDRSNILGLLSMAHEKLRARCEYK